MTNFNLLLDHGWHSQLIYQPPLAPSLAYISPLALTGKPTILIDAGIHGEEPAPVLALTKSIPNLLKLKLKYGLVVIPILNPVGYKNKTRYIDHQLGPNGYPTSVGDMSHVLGWDNHGTWIPASAIPNNPYCDQLSSFVVKICQQINLRLILDLHEDNLPHLPPGGYIYPLSPASIATAQAVIKIFSKYHVPPLNNCQTRFGEAIQAGLVHPTPNASFPELLMAKSLSTSPQALTIETTTNLPLSTRISVYQAIITHMVSSSANKL